MSADSWISIAVAIIGLAASLFGAGGIVMHFINRKEAKDKKEWERVLEGIRLGLENDMVIFKALRDNHINGESEKQEEKMNAYFRKAFL